MKPVCPSTARPATPDLPAEGRRRVQIEGVAPEVDGGRFPVKRIAGDALVVEADLVADGHDRLAAVVLHRRGGEEAWGERPMEPLPNDRWRARIPLPEVGRYEYTILAWVDPFRTWCAQLEKWAEAGMGREVAVELLSGARIVDEALERARSSGEGKGRDRGSPTSGDPEARLEGWARRLREWAESPEIREDPSPLLEADGPIRGTLPSLMARVPDRRFATHYEEVVPVDADRERAAFSAWYEFFPRSAAAEPGRHGTFRDARRMLPYVQEMGFDVVYLPPIHPVGTTNRKGRNNRPTAEPGEPGSPWAIGAAEGGHTAVHPDLGTLGDFRAFRKAAEAHGLEVALDIAFQCSPDHPWVKERPEWFRHRSDGSIRYAENPPKKYQDIYPLEFENEAWAELWLALRDVFRFWVDEGVRIFRVDNPHTKPLPFWEWVIGDLKGARPDLIFLSEAFTRPRMMYRLAKLGFTQSYTYFSWRNTKSELTAYLEELVEGEVREYFRPNFWPNTPDILTEFLQTGGRPAFMVRLVLAATLSSNYGIYGPAFELLEHRPREPGSEEYLDSEKYEIRRWDLEREDSLRPYIARVNRIRREEPAFRRNDTLRFHPVDNDRILAYTKTAPEGETPVLTVVNLDPHHMQSGWVELDPGAFDLPREGSFQAHDLLGGGRYFWEGGRHFVSLAPHESPAQIFRLLKRQRSEEDFDYF